MPGPMIPEELYRRVVKVLPIVCVDVILRVPDGRFLLVRRADEPLKGEWWVVGGRLLLGETALAAATRKVRHELGVHLAEDELAFVGYYEDQFDHSAFGEGTYQTVSLVFDSTLPALPDITLDGHSTDWCLADRLPDRLTVVPSTSSTHFSYSGRRGS